MKHNDAIGERAEERTAVPLSTVIKRMIWLCMLPLFLFAAGMAIYQIGVIHRQEDRQATILTKNAILATDNTINSRIKALNMLALSPFVDDLARWQDLYREAQGFYRSYGTHVVISDGATPPQLLLNTRVPFGTKLPAVKNQNGRLAGPIAMRTGKPAVSDLFQGPVAHKLLIGIAVPVIREEKAKFVILTVIGRSFFQEQMDRVDLPPGWSIVLKDAEGETIASKIQSSIQTPAARFVAHSKISNWTVAVEIPPGAHWQPLIESGMALGVILLGVTLAGFIGGKWAGHRIGRAVASLTENPVAGTLPPDILEIAAARRLLDQETQRRAAVENTLRQSEHALKEKALEYGAMFERSVVGKAQVDPVTACYLKVNQAFADLTGYSPEELCGMTFKDITHPDDLERDVQSLEAIRAGGTDRWQAEKRYLKKDGSVIWVNVSGNVIHLENDRQARIITVIQDITDRKRAEEALKESLQQYNTIGDAIPYGVWVADAQGLCTYASSSFLEMVGMTLAQVQEFGWLHLLPEKDAEPTRDHWLSCVQTGQDFNREHRFKSSDGSYRDVLAIGRPLRREDGTIVKWVGLNLDITDRKRTEDQLRESEERLRSSLAEKEVLLKEVHHRVKNNMQIIASLVDLQANELEDAAMRNMMNDVIYRVRSMAMVHEKLYQSTDLARVEFAGYARSLLGYLWRALGAAASGIQMKLDLQAIYLPVTAAVPCGLMLNELFSNALKHAFAGRDGGEVAVSLQSDENGRVCLEVRDDGIGLPPETDLKTVRSLGLRLVQMLAGQLHATLELESDRGTRFSIIFMSNSL